MPFQAEAALYRECSSWRGRREDVVFNGETPARTPLRRKEVVNGWVSRSASAQAQVHRRHVGWAGGTKQSTLHYSHRVFAWQGHHLSSNHDRCRSRRAKITRVYLFGATSTRLGPSAYALGTRLHSNSFNAHMYLPCRSLGLSLGGHGHAG